MKSLPGLEHGELLDLLDSENAHTVAGAIDVLRTGAFQSAIPALERLEDDRRRSADGQEIGALARRAIEEIESGGAKDAPAV